MHKVMTINNTTECSNVTVKPLGTRVSEASSVDTGISRGGAQSARAPPSGSSSLIIA